MLLNQPPTIFEQIIATDAQPVSFRVREIPICGDLILSPMDGYSDLPFRLLCRELGSAMSYTEFVNVDALRFGDHKPNNIAWRKLKYDPSEYPMTFQIYGHDEDRIVETAIRLQDLGPDIIDLNMGCYVKDVAERGAGSGMLRDPAKIGRIFARLSTQLRVPVTGKIRLGWDDATRNHVTVAKILEDNGASVVAVHARTKEQAYRGEADWDAIAEVKQAVRIPVIGNGDVKSVADIARIKAHTGCDGVMIGRGAIGNPWIFSRLDRDQVPAQDKIALMRRHFALNLDFYGERIGLVLFRKHAAKYIHGVPGADRLRLALLTCNTPEEVECLIAELAQDSERHARTQT
ncbi:MAG: tRNA dihydrouridine synthase DusB [Chloroflexi bacterium]|nr:tRNA dihydrouridine synthase DusB [Chloroflexota bacterium]